MNLLMTRGVLQTQSADCTTPKANLLMRCVSQNLTNRRQLSMQSANADATCLCLQQREGSETRQKVARARKGPRKGN